jgi:hypothetical protein
MQATCQNSSPDIIMRRHQARAVSMVTRVENHVMTIRLLLLQSVASQSYDNYTVVITPIIVQLSRAQRLLLVIPTPCILKISRGQFRYILLRRASIAFILFYQSARIMERSC